MDGWYSTILTTETYPVSPSIIIGASATELGKYVYTSMVFGSTLFTVRILLLPLLIITMAFTNPMPFKSLYTVVNLKDIIASIIIIVV